MLHRPLVFDSIKHCQRTLSLFYVSALLPLLLLTQVEVFSESTKEYVPVTFPTNINDPTLPDFTRLLQDGPTTVDLTAYLDRNKPLSEPKWVRTGDIEDWLTAVFISKPSSGPEGRGAWAGKIEVTDPDPVRLAHPAGDSLPDPDYSHACF